MLSSRGLIGAEPGEAISEQLARHGLVFLHPDARIRPFSALSVESMRSWPSGLEAFYKHTVANSNLCFPSASNYAPPSPATDIIRAVLVAPEPLSLVCIGDLVGISWQMVLRELAPVILLFRLDHRKRESYIADMDEEDLRDHELVLGDRAHYSGSLSSALSTVSVCITRACTTGTGHLSLF